MGKCLFMRKGETHTAPVGGIKASEIAVGSSVYLIENGSPVEYLVVNQGIPSSSSLYDSSCDGMWILRKDILQKRKWASSNNSYADSAIHTYLNNTVFGLFDEITKNTIKQVKIPYTNGMGYGGSVATGANGLSTRVFLLSATEIGIFPGMNVMYPNTEGAQLSYFEYGIGDSATAKRTAYFSGTQTAWWTRSPNTADQGSVLLSTCEWGTYSTQYGVRPALILPHNALFDKNTLILKGVA